MYTCLTLEHIDGTANTGNQPKICCGKSTTSPQII